MKSSILSPDIGHGYHYHKGKKTYLILIFINMKWEELADKPLHFGLSSLRNRQQENSSFKSHFLFDLWPFFYFICFILILFINGSKDASLATGEQHHNKVAAFSLIHIGLTLWQKSQLIKEILLNRCFLRRSPKSVHIVI